MANINKNNIIDNFSKYAHMYEEHSSVQRDCGDQLMDMIKDIKADRILEIGCGTGRLTRNLRKKFRSAEIFAVDISPQMITAAKKKSMDDGIGFIVSDGEKFDFYGKFDLIVSNASFQWFNDLSGTINRFTRMLCENGMLCFSMYGPGTFNELRKILTLYYGSSVGLSSGEFVHLEDIESIVGAQFGLFELRERSFTKKYSSLMEFLRDIKKSGTRGEGIADGNFLGRESITEMEKLYIRKFGGITATHNVYFCKARNI